MPSWFLRKPREYRGDHVYLIAFERLSTTRTFSAEGMGPIAWNHAWAYARGTLGMQNRRIASFFCDVLLMLDSHYREHLRKQQEEAEKRELRDARRAERAAREEAGGKMTRR